MFSSHKQLIGSPNNRDDRLNSNSEFTPIGVRSRNTNNPSRNTAKIRTNIDGSPTSINKNSRSQLLHRNKFDGSSSFSNDNSDISNSSSEIDENEDNDRKFIRHKKRDLFSNGSILGGTNVLPNYSSDEESIGTIKEDGLIRNKETNMLKLQHDQVKKLQGENMNLRVEVMSLRRNLTGLPVETNELIDQNITLNQEIVRLRELVENYQLRENKVNNNNSENADYEIQSKQYEEKIENLENKLQVIIDERDDKAQEIERLNDDIDILNNRLDQKDQEIEERKLHENSIVSTHNSGQELKDLQSDLKFREQEIDNLHDEIEELNLKLKHFTKENNLLREDLDEIETRNNIDAEPNKLQDFEHQKIELQTRIDQLEKELRELKLEKIDLKKYIDKLEEDEEKEVRKQYKSSRDLLRDMSDQLDNASKSIDTLENELKQKDSDIKQLNSKILNLQTKNSELVERLEKLKSSKSKTTDLLTNEIDDVYAKINELKEINIKLESENHELSQSLSSNEGYDNDYVEDIKEDREILYNSLLKTEKKLIEKLSEIKSLKDQIQNLERKAENNNEINEEPRSSDGNFNENIELINNLQLRIEEERDKHIETIERLESEFNTEKNSLTYKIETLEDDKLRLIEDYENIQMAYKDLEADFEKEVNQNVVVSDFNDLESDFKNLSIQYKIAVDNKLIYETEIEELKNKIKLKDLELLELHNDLTELSKMEKSTDIRTKLESKIILIEEKVVELTKERNELLDNKLQTDEELNKIRLENIKLNKKVDSSKKICSQFEIQLDEANKDKKVLRLELKEQNKEINRLEKNISKLEMERTNLVESLDKLNTDQKNIIKKNDQLSDNLKFVFKDHGENKNELEIKFNEKENQFNRLVDEYNSMKNDLIGKYEDSKLERIKLADKLIEKDKILSDTKRKFELSNGKVKVLEKYVDGQNKDIDSIKVELERARDQLQNQNQWFPPTPESPSHITNDQQSRLFTLQNRIDILEAQKKLMMIKLQELKTESGDLQFMIHYLEAEIKSKNGTIERNIILLRTANINTISSSKKSKLTFKGVAFAVLASIRLKKRLNELKIRRAQEMAVKKQLSQKQKYS